MALYKFFIIIIIIIIMAWLFGADHSTAQGLSTNSLRQIMSVWFLNTYENL